MYVGIVRITVVIDQSHSLKEKRMVIRRVKDRVRERLGVAINEVGELDRWQAAELGCAVTSGERQKALEIDRVGRRGHGRREGRVDVRRAGRAVRSRRRSDRLGGQGGGRRRRRLGAGRVEGRARPVADRGGREADPWRCDLAPRE